MAKKLSVYLVTGVVSVNEQRKLYKINTTLECYSAQEAIEKAEMTEFNRLEIKLNLVGQAFIVWYQLPTVRHIRDVTEAELMSRAGYAQLPGMEAV